MMLQPRPTSRQCSRWGWRLDRWCRSHEVDNLFVVDGGPFPTGTGINPTLTIMANAWRVAEHIANGSATGS
jgi:choline dehydrogenase-like flavoprotein